MIKEMRRFLFVESEIPREDVSISGYWRIGMTEDQWQSSKQEFNADIEAEEERDRKSTRLNSSHVATSYAVFCVKKKTPIQRERRRVAHTCSGTPAPRPQGGV